MEKIRDIIFLLLHTKHTFPYNLCLCPLHLTPVDAEMSDEKKGIVEHCGK